MDYCPLLLWLSWWRIHLQCRRPGFYPWVGKIPRRREWLPTPVFWPGEFHGLCSPWVCKELHMTDRVSLSLSQPWIGSCKAHQKPSCNFTLFFTEGLRKRGLLYTLPSPSPTPHRKKPTIQLGIGLWLLESVGLFGGCPESYLPGADLSQVAGTILPLLDGRGSWTRSPCLGPDPTSKTPQSAQMQLGP